MKIPLYERVALRVELPQEGLRPGDIATLVDYVSGPKGETGCVLEVFNVLGESVAVVAVGESEIEQLSENEIPSARPRAKAMR